METGCINRGFYNGKGLGKFRAKQFGCNKRLVALTEDVLSGLHCICSLGTTLLQSGTLIPELVKAR